MKYFYLLFFVGLGFSDEVLAKSPALPEKSAKIKKSSVPKKTSVVEKTLAVVEGEMISLMDLKEAQRRLKAGFLNDSVVLSLFQKSKINQNGYKKGVLLEGFSSFKKAFQRKKPSIITSQQLILLELMIYEKLLDISAKESGMQIEDSHLKQELNKIRKKKKLSKKAFSRWLVRNQWTSIGYRAFLRKSLLRKRFIQKEVVEKIQISDSDLNAYALQKEGKPLFSTFEYDLSYLLFPLGKEGEKQAQKALKLISKDNALFEKWEVGGVKKGQFKKIKLSALSPSIREAIKKLSVGQVSPVLVLPAGYHIFKAIWKTPVITAQNQKRKAQLSALLFEELFKKKLKSWLENRKTRAFIQVF